MELAPDRYHPKGSLTASFTEGLLGSGIDRVAPTRRHASRHASVNRSLLEDGLGEIPSHFAQQDIEALPEVDLCRRGCALPRSDMRVQGTIRDVAKRGFDMLERAPDRPGAVACNLTEIVATKNRWHVVNDRPGEHGNGNSTAGTPSRTFSKDETNRTDRFRWHATPQSSSHQRSRRLNGGVVPVAP